MSHNDPTFEEPLADGDGMQAMEQALIEGEAVVDPEDMTIIDPLADPAGDDEYPREDEPLVDDPLVEDALVEDPDLD